MNRKKQEVPKQAQVYWEFEVQSRWHLSSVQNRLLMLLEIANPFENKVAYHQFYPDKYQMGFICLKLLLLSRFSRVQLFVTLWTVARQAPLSMGFSRQEYQSGLPCPPPGDLPDPGIQPRSPALQTDSLLLIHQGTPYLSARAGITEQHGICGLNIRNLFSHPSGGWKSKVKVLATQLPIQTLEQSAEASPVADSQLPSHSVLTQPFLCAHVKSLLGSLVINSCNPVRFRSHPYDLIQPELQSFFLICRGLFPGPSLDTKVQECSSSIYKMVQYLHITHTLPIIQVLKNVYLAVPGLSYDMRDLIAEACELLVAACGIQFPDQRLNLGPYIRSTESQPLDHQGGSSCTLNHLQITYNAQYSLNAV